MRLEHPSLLAVAAALPLVALLFAHWERWRRRSLAQIAVASVRRDVMDGRPRPFFRGVSTLAALALLAVAAAGPMSGFPSVSKERRDIVVVLDTSLSMAAEDIRPSRMENARETVRALLSRVDGERVGVVAFAGRGVVQSPLTRDYAAVAMLTDSLVPGLLRQPGSNLADALLRAEGLFGQHEGRSRVVLLLTDGEEHEPEAGRLAARLARKGVRVFALGLGTPEGAPIPLRDDSAITGYKTDRQGRTVTTRLNALLLSRLAGDTGGKFYRAAPDGHVVEPLLAALTSEGRSRGGSGFRRAQFALGVLALVCLVLAEWSEVLPPRAREKRVLSGAIPR
jgi:Ca-activated chloride channel family protein